MPRERYKTLTKSNAHVLDVYEALFAWVAVASVVALAATVLDKSRARRGASRIPERTLLGLALVGGSPGLLVGMMFARHKTRKLSFLAGFAFVLAVQVGLVWWWLR